MKKLFSLSTDQFSKFWTGSGFTAQRTGSKTVIATKKESKCRHDFYPAGMADRFEIRAEFIPGSAGPLFIEMPPYYLNIDDHQHFSYLSRSNSSDHLKNSTTLLLRPGQINTLKVNYDSGRVLVSLNGNDGVRFKSKYRPAIDQIAMTWPNKTLIHRLDVSGSFVPKFVKPARSEGYVYHMVVDFPDDIIPAPYTRPMLDDLMRQFADAGIKRVSWIYYGGRKAGTWDKTGNCFYPTTMSPARLKRSGTTI